MKTEIKTDNRLKMKTVMIKESFNGLGFIYKKTESLYAKPGIGKEGVFFKIKNVPHNIDDKQVESALLKTTFIDRNLDRYELSYSELGLNKEVRSLA